MAEPLSQAAAWPPGSTTPPRLQAPQTAWWALAAQLAGMFMALLDSTVVNVALPSQSQPGGRRQGADAHAVAQGDAHIGTGEHRRNAGRPAHARHSGGVQRVPVERGWRGHQLQNGTEGQERRNADASQDRLLNVRDQIDGHEIRTVAVDPERAPFIRLASSSRRPATTP